MPALKVWVANERLTSADLNANFASVVGPDGVVASAASSTSFGSAVALTTLVEGKAAYLSGGRIVTPRAGLYLVSGVATMVASSSPAVTGQCSFTVVGVPAIGLDFYLVAAASNKFTFALPVVLASGTQITGQFGSAGGGVPTCTIHRIGFVFMGTGYAP